jgi:hypothetical protein
MAQNLVVKGYGEDLNSFNHVVINKDGSINIRLI